MNTTGRRVVLDTNVFITILSKRGENRWIFDAILSGELILCLSNEILFEYWEVLESKTSPSTAQNVIEFLVVHPHVSRHTPYINWNLISSDPDDNKFADCYLTSNAQFLISNDKDFSSLKTIGFPKINLLTTGEFKELYDKIS